MKVFVENCGTENINLGNIALLKSVITPLSRVLRPRTLILNLAFVFLCEIDALCTKTLVQSTWFDCFLFFSWDAKRYLSLQFISIELQ